jgi:predicted N-acetyltransferase YhbS
MDTRQSGHFRIGSECGNIPRMTTSSGPPLHIRLMTPGDLNFALRLVEGENWGTPPAEVARILAHGERGCFVAERPSCPIGMIMTACYGPSGWIGNLIVSAAYRGQGVGRQLLRKSVSELRARGVETIRLDAEPPAVSLYQREGFVEEDHSLRLQGAGILFFANDVLPMEPSDLDEALHLDQMVFAADRGRILRATYQEAPERCFVYRANGELQGYVMARLTLGSGRIGPFIGRPGTSSRRAARQLLRAALASLHGYAVAVGIPERNRTGVELLLQHGFCETPYCIRMRLGPDKYCADSEGEFAIGSPAKG